MSNSFLPDFLAIGPPKTATTSLYRYLCQHPEIFLPENKETSFFTFEGMPEVHIPGMRLITDLDMYRALYLNTEHSKARGEVSPLYLVSARAPRRIAELLPDVKLIATLRNPVERAYSEYLMNIRNGVENRDFRTAVLSEPMTERQFAANHYNESRIIRNGFYFEHLSRYYDLFPPEQIRVYLFEEITHQPQTFLSSVLRFLKVDPTFPIDTSIHYNSAHVPKHRWLHFMLTRRNIPREMVKMVLPPSLRDPIRETILRFNMHRPPSQLTPDIRQVLVDRFADDILKLEKLIDRDLQHWLTIPIEA